MKKSQILRTVLGIVAEEMEIDINVIISRDKTTEVVDARHLVIALLHNQRIYVQAIADMIHCTPRAVQYAITDFADRAEFNPSLKSAYNRALKRLRNATEETAN